MKEDSRETGLKEDGRNTGLKEDRGEDRPEGSQRGKQVCRKTQEHKEDKSEGSQRGRQAGRKEAGKTGL